LSCHFDSLPLTFGSLKSMEVSPFRGIRFNRRLVGDLARVICRPYDVITPEQQRLYYEKSDYNAIRLEFPEPTSDRYDRAARTFEQWLKQGVVEYDSISAFYLHEHQFKYFGRRMVRRGLIARVRLEAWGKSVFPHEETSSKAKSDRLHLMRACRANFSPLFCLYQDSEQRIAPTLGRAAQEKPLISLRAGPGNLPDPDEAHSLWAVTDRETKRELGKLLSSQPIYIADGHHRYETALTYQQERTQASHEQVPSPFKGEGKGEGEEAFNYVMMELVEFCDPGLVVLPLHRLVRGIASSALARMEKQLESFFTLEFVSFGDDSLTRCHYEPLVLSVIASEAKQSHRPQDTVLGILGLHSGALALLGRRQDISLEALMPGDRSQAYREFSISILNHIILDKVLGLTSEEDVAYTVDFEEAYQQIKEGKYQLAFLLNPPRPQMVKAVADVQDRMPRKSTYFYPKVPAGLVINPLD
jgi:uncharacterized protein (DUF1015 family)